MRLLRVFSGIALLCAPAMAQDPFIPDTATADWNTINFQWTNQSSNNQWNLYDVVTSDPNLDDEDAVYRSGWAAEVAVDDNQGDGNEWLLGTMDLDGGGIPDDFEFALVGALRYGTAGDGGALLFPDFGNQYEVNNLNITGDDPDTGPVWEDWGHTRAWYAGLQAYSQDWIDLFEGGPSLFTHADGDAMAPGVMAPYAAGSGALGDPDDDGLTNLQEYQANTGDRWAFALAAITPSASVAPDQNVVEAVSAYIGDNVTLTVSNAGAAGSGEFTWTLDGDAIAGETDGTLALTDLVADDSGAYVASFDDGSKAANTYTANLTVTASPTGLPVAGLFGLVALAVGLAAGGTAAVRRRK